MSRIQQLDLPRLGLGTASQSGVFQAVSAETASAVLEAAWAAGIRYFDTAPWYGFGLSELRLGEFLRGHEGAILSSKVGRVLSKEFPPHPSQVGAFGGHTDLNVRYDYSYDGVMRSFEDSLKRLGVDKIDVLLIHDPDVTGVGVAELMRGAHRALSELREQGAIQAFGAGMNGWEYLQAFLRAGDPDVFLLAGRYTLLNQSSLGFLDECAAREVGVIAGSVFNSGLLADPQPGAPYNYAPVTPEVLRRALDLKEVCQAYGVPLTHAALQFPLGHSAVISVLTAAETPAQLEQNLAAARTPVPPALWADLRAHGLIDPAAPTPKGGA